MPYFGTQSRWFIALKLTVLPFLFARVVAVAAWEAAVSEARGLYRDVPIAISFIGEGVREFISLAKASIVVGFNACIDFVCDEVATRLWALFLAVFFPLIWAWLCIKVLIDDDAFSLETLLMWGSTFLAVYTGRLDDLR